MRTLYHKAVRHLEFGELDEAEDALHSYLQENPSDAMAHNKLGVVYVQRPNLEEAKRCFEEALKHDRYLVHALNNLGNIAREEGELEQAIGYYQKAILIDQDYPPAHNNLGVVYKQLHRYGDFIHEIKTAKRLENKKVLNSEKPINIKSWIKNLWSKLRK